MAKSLYETLEVNENATADEIKKAYRKLAVQYHPDKTGGDDAKFKEINEAYESLSNPDKRAQYDGTNNNPFGGGFGGGFGFDINDLFRDHFTGGRNNRNFPEPGQDIKIEVVVNLFEVLSEAKKRVDYTLVVDCDICKGTGASETNTCPTCKGSGAIKKQVSNAGMFMSSFSPCPSCGGRGFSVKKVCTECSNGKRRLEKTLEFNVPPNANNGSIIRFSGSGGLGRNGGRPGDAYICFALDLPKKEKLTAEQIDFLKTLYVHS